MSRAPTSRKFTLADVRSLSIEKRSFHLTWMVALFAATISFFSLTWVGIELAGDYPSWVPYWVTNLLLPSLLPLTIDGLGIICSFGIIRSHSAGEPFKNRASEWIGLCMSLALSMVGNGAHAIGVVPWWLKLVYSCAVPGVIGYAIHVLGRYGESGVMSHVYASAPDEVALDVPQLGDAHAPALAQPAPRPARPAAQAVTQARAAARAVERARQTPVGDTTREALFQEYRARKADGDRMDGNAIAERLGIHPGNARTLRGKWDARIEQEAAEPDSDPILEQVDAGRGSPLRSTA